MAETPRLDLPYLSASQAQKEVMHNISLDRLDLLVQCAVLDRNLTTPPGSPTLGDAYIVAAPGTGAWAGHDNHLALWISSQWEFIAPLPGFTCWVNDESVLVYWSGTVWVIASGGGGATSFLALTDTPDTYSGQAGKAVLVNAGGTALEFGTSGGGAPVDATYIVSSANTTLTAERVLTNSPSLTWNTGTAGQVSADIPANGVTLDQIEQLPFPALLGRGNPPTGNVEPVTVGAGLTLTGGTLALSSAPGVADFLSLTDTPDSYSGQGGKVVAVNPGATALEFITAAGGGGGAPPDAEYITSTTNATLSAERVLTDTATVIWDRTTAGQVHAHVPDDAITYAKLQNVTGGAKLLGRGSGAGAGNAEEILIAAPLSMSGTTITCNAPTGTGTGGQVTYWGGTSSLSSAGYLHFDPTSRSTRINNGTVGTSGQGILAIGTGTAPTTSPANTVQLWTRERNGVASKNSLHIRTEDGTSHVLGDLTGIGTVVPTEKLEVSGGIKLGAAVALGDGTLQWTGTDLQLRKGGVWTPLSGGATTFLALTDTPDVYAANALKILRVNAGATAVEFGPVLGTMAEQASSNVAITGGTIALAASSQTVSPYGAFVANDVAVAEIVGFRSLVNTGTNKWNILADGTAPNYFAGNVGIGTPDAGYNLRVNTNIRGFLLYLIEPAQNWTIVDNSIVSIKYDKNARYGMTLHQMTDGGPGQALRFVNNAGTEIGTISTNATATAYNTSSDVRLKHSIATLTNALAKMAALNPVSFKWNADDSTGVGFLAHELMTVVPEAVTGLPDEVHPDGSVKPQQVDHSKIVPWLVSAVQELSAQVQSLTARVADLEAALA